MKYALVNDERLEAAKGLSGKCPCCDHPTIAKCGKLKIWHWAHRGKRMCDLWWDNETAWHRAWKGQFPKECQEFVQHATDGEKHIADVKIDQGYVIEFQHSFIKPEERQAREDFYTKMVWVVDGARRVNDKKKFTDVLEQSKSLDAKVDVRKLWGYFDECALLREWGGSNVPVFFDFGEDTLWGLLPRTLENGTYAFRMGRKELIACLRPAPQVSFDAFLKRLAEFLIIKEMKEALSAVQYSSQSQRPSYPLRRSNRL